jgi:hypothetical protein
MGIISVGFDVQWINNCSHRLFYFGQIGLLEKEKFNCNGAVRQLFTDFKKAHDSVRREVLYYILI